MEAALDAPARRAGDRLALRFLLRRFRDGGRSGTGSGSGGPAAVGLGVGRLGLAPSAGRAREPARRCAAVGHGSASPLSQAGRARPGQRPRKSAPSAPSQNACTIAEIPASWNTISAPAITPRMPMNGREQPDAPRAQRQHHEQERHAHRARPSGAPAATGLMSLRSLARSSPGLAADRRARGELVGDVDRLERVDDAADREQDRCGDRRGRRTSAARRRRARPTARNR